MKRKIKQKLRTKQLEANLVKLENYDLGNIENDFEIPHFQRKIYSTHVRYIKNSIAENGLLNRVFSVYKDNGKWKVSDGQQRLAALSLGYGEKIFDRETIYLNILPSENMEENYRILNRGKPLSVNDVVKSFDNGEIPFFNQLSEWCSYYGSNSKLSYWNVISAYHYAIGSQKDSIQIKDIKRVTFNLQQDDISKLKRFILDMYVAFGSNFKSKPFGAAFFRNIMKIYFQDGHLSKKLLNGVRNDNVLEAFRASGRDIDSYRKIYERMKELQRD